MKLTDLLMPGEQGHDMVMYSALSPSSLSLSLSLQLNQHFFPRFLFLVLIQSYDLSRLPDTSKGGHSLT